MRWVKASAFFLEETPSHELPFTEPEVAAEPAVPGPTRAGYLHAFDFAPSWSAPRPAASPVEPDQAGSCLDAGWDSVG
jgi:hypothetical protein